MTKVKVIPGPCKLEAVITAEENEDGGVNVKVETDCKSINDLMASVDEEFDPFEICFAKPGNGPLVESINENGFPVHGSCPVLNAIVKAIEAEAGLALEQNVVIEFID
ncbi:MAG: hypothetical protein MJ086_04170 [Lachnospiraceae bacterium]|nr:hypothetical protein [Lachnospiraceae bacterium]